MSELDNRRVTVERRGRAIAVAALFAVALVGAACSSSGGSGQSGPTTTSGQVGATVVLKNIRFNPPSVTIHAGQSVEWKWEDAPTPHNVSGTGFKSPSQSTGSYTHTFTTAGTYDYVCDFHPNMVGKVVVTAS